MNSRCASEVIGLSSEGELLLRIRGDGLSPEGELPLLAIFVKSNALLVTLARTKVLPDTLM